MSDNSLKSIAMRELSKQIICIPPALQTEILYQTVEDIKNEYRQEISRDIKEQLLSEFSQCLPKIINDVIRGINDNRLSPDFHKKYNQCVKDYTTMSTIIEIADKTVDKIDFQQFSRSYTSINSQERFTNNFQYSSSDDDENNFVNTWF